MKKASVSKFIERLQGPAGTLEYPRAEIIHLLQQAAQENTEALGKVVDAYVDFTKRYWAEQGLGSEADAKMGALENMACAAAMADFVGKKPASESEIIAGMYETTELHGHTMRSLMTHLKMDGHELARKYIRQAKHKLKHLHYRQN